MYVTSIENNLYLCFLCNCNSIPFGAAWAYYGKVLVLASVVSWNGHVRGEVK